MQARGRLGRGRRGQRAEGRGRRPPPTKFQFTRICRGTIGVMSKVVQADYDAEANVFRLVEPLEGLADHQRVTLTVTPSEDGIDRPWLVLSGSLSREAGESLSKAVDELFPPWTQ